MRKGYFADVSWEIDDVIAAAEAQGVKLTKEQARKWWEIHENLFRSEILNRGSEILEYTDFQAFVRNGGKK